MLTDMLLSFKGNAPRCIRPSRASAPRSAGSKSSSTRTESSIPPTPSETKSSVRQRRNSLPALFVCAPRADAVSHIVPFRRLSQGLEAVLAHG